MHSDVWGPAPIVAYSGYRYFVTFVDDCTRCTWAYLMKEKYEVANLFQGPTLLYYQRLERG